MVLPKKNDCKALKACSILARVMQEEDRVALVHFVAQDNAAPRLGCLTPRLGESPLLRLSVSHVQACRSGTARQPRQSPIPLG